MEQKFGRHASKLRTYLEGNALPTTHERWSPQANAIPIRALVHSLIPCIQINAPRRYYCKLCTNRDDVALHWPVEYLDDAWSRLWVVSLWPISGNHSSNFSHVGCWSLLQKRLHHSPAVFIALHSTNTYPLYV
jgi:hypothetical protein